MKTTKKLLNSTLILALVFGQTSGTVVEAVSNLKTIQSSTTKKVTQTKETTESSANKKSTKDAKVEKKAETKTKEKSTEESKAKTNHAKEETSSVRALEENPTFTLPQPIPSETDLANDTAYIAHNLISYISRYINDLLDVSTDNFTVGDTIKVTVPNVYFNKEVNNPADFWNSFGNWPSDLRQVAALASMSGSDYTPVYYMEANSASGNWKIRISPSDKAVSIRDLDLKLYVTLTRLKEAPPKKETFSTNTLFSMLTDGYKTYYAPVSFSVDFPDAESSYGKIKAKVKPGEFNLEENQAIPNPENYVTAENTRGKVTYEWVTKPDTSQLGKQKVKILVKDASGRSAEVEFEITVKELLSVKKATDTIYQYAAVPDVKDYFDVTTDGGYTLQWADTYDTSTPGNYTWQAKVKTADGREQTKAITMKILDHPGIQLKLKPIEDRTMTLVENSDTLAKTFKNYIEEATMLGEPVPIDDLEFVASESSNTAFQSVGKQEITITVQAKHPVSNVMIKGSGTTTVNVLWGNTILIRSANGHSAGAFALDVGNSNGAPATLAIKQGIESPLNEGVGDPNSLFGLYYNLEILRNGNSVYSQDVTNRATLQEIMNAYGNTQNNVTVQMGDIIKIHYPSKMANGSVVMVNEQEQNYTYGSEYAYYKVTPYGFDPAPVMSAESADKEFVLGEDPSQINLKDLVKNVMINGAVADDAFYTVENLSDFDTTTIGKRTMKVKITTNDGLASKEVEVSYNVKWGSTFVIKGLNDATVGAFSLLKNKDQWQIKASQGVDETDLDAPVNNLFGRVTYYSIEVLRGGSSANFYSVAGNQSIRESINGFNDGQPLNVSKGDVIKVYHAEPVGKNLLMEDELVKDYTIGSNYAYYEVTDHGLEAILAITAESSPQEFVLGEDSSAIDGAKLVNSIVINGTPVASDKYTVTQTSQFDTSVVGEQNIRVKIDTKDGMVSKEIDVPYTVKWGESFLVKSSTGGSAGAFSLLDGKELAGTSSDAKVLKISAGLDSSFDEKINPENEANVYYSLQITRNGNLHYSQDMPGRATLQQIMNNFGDGSNSVTVRTGDIITVNQPQKVEGSSILWQDEAEKDFTYGSTTARYKVTDYGLEPAPELKGTTANKQLNLTEQAENVDLKQLLSEVTVNGHAISTDLYTVKQLTDFDTKTVGKREVKLQIDLNDGYGSTEVDIPYEVKWGDSIVLKGLNDATVGVYSFINKNNQWYLSATQGDPDADLTNWVNNEFGRDIYYRIEVVEGGNNLELLTQLLDPNGFTVDTGNFVYDVTGNMTFGQAITGFNNGQPLPVSQGAVIKVYHADPSRNNLLIQDDAVKDYTAGLNYAYYRVTAAGIEPITDLKAKFAQTSLTLGQDTTETDIKQMIENVEFNDQKLNADLYKAEPMDSFDTSTVGEKELKVKLTTSDNVTTKEIKVPYSVKWGSTLVMKNPNNDTVGAFTLTKEGKKLQIVSVPGNDKASLSKRVTDENDQNVYYSIEVFSQNTSKYKYEVHGSQTIEQAISRFNSEEPLAVSAGDQIKVYHTEPSGNNLVAEEKEKNYTYGTNYAYYNVTEYGFEPTGELDVMPKKEAKIAVNTKEVDLKSLLQEVKVNGKVLPNDSYKVELGPEAVIDTSKLGSQTVKMNVTADQSYGGFSKEAEVTFSVVEQSEIDGTGENAADGSENADPEGNLPKTNESKNAAFSLLGALLVSMVGLIWFWKKRKNNEEIDTQK